MTDRVRRDWAKLATLAEVHEQDEPRNRVTTNAADRVWAEIERLRAGEQRVRKLHWRHHDGYCVHCSLLDDQDVPYPCPTVRALDGETT